MTQYFIDTDGNYLGGFDGAEPPEGSIEVDTPPAHGSDKWTNGAWVVVAIVPESVPKLNARLTLIDAGYWDEVVAFVTAQGAIALAYLQDAQTMRRDNPLVNAWAKTRSVPISDAALDGLFIAAAARVV